MAITRADLATTVLRHLVGSEEGATAGDLQLVKDAIDRVFEELLYAEVAYWDPDDIPPQMVHGLKRMVAAEVGPSFAQYLALPEREAERKMGEQMVRRMAARPRSGEPAEANYY